MTRAISLAVSLLVAIAAAAAQTVTIHIDSASNGKPIRGALAWWIAPDAGAPLQVRSNLQSDEQGKLDVPLVAGSRLRIWAKGYEVVELDSAEVASTHELALWPGTAAALQLRGATTPVHLRYFIGPRSSARELSATTDAAGRIGWPGTPRDGIRVEIVDPRFAVTGVTLRAGDHRELALHPVRRILARVVGVNGRPIAKAKASSFVAIGPNPNDVRRLDWTSGDDGVIALTSLPDGEHVVEFTADGFVTRSLRVNAGQQSRIADVQMIRGAPFVLIVRDDSGPIEGATVSVEDGDRLLTDHAGRVTIAGLDVRQQPQLRVSATNYLPTSFYVRPDMKSPWEVDLRRGSGVRFRLLDASTGDPVEHARVRVHASGHWSDRNLNGPRGEYFAAGFQGGRLQIRIAAAGYLPTTISADSAAGTADLGVLFLSRGAVVTGTLVDFRTGKPIVGARVETIPREQMGTLAARLFGDTIATTTNANGRFSLSGLNAGVLCAMVTHPSVPQIPLPLGQVDANSTRDVGVLSIGESGAVDGALRDSDGAPIPGANVELRFGPVYSPCMTLFGAIDDHGKYHFNRVAPGAYHLIALHDHEVLGTRGIVVRGGSTAHEDLEIRTVAVHGSITVQGLPGSGGRVMLKHVGSDDFTPPTIFFRYIGPGMDPRQLPVTDIVGKASFSVGSDGTFEGKSRLDPGDYDVMWTPADNSAWYHSSVSLTPDSKSLNVQPQFDGVPVSGRVWTPDGSAIGGAFIQLLDVSGRVQRSTFAAADGSFVIPQVPPGRWIVDGTVRGATGRQTVDVEAKSPDPMKLVLAPAQPSRLVVQIGDDPDADKIDSILVSNSAGIVRMARADPAATFEDLPPGAYKIFGLDRRGGIVAGDVVTVGTSSMTATLTSRPTHNVRIRCRNSEPGQRIALFSDGYSVVPLLAYEGLTLSVLDDGTIALPPLSDGTWTLQVGDRKQDIEVSRDATFDLGD